MPTSPRAVLLVIPIRASRRRRSTGWLVRILLAHLMLLLTRSTSGDDLHAQLEVIREGYLANRSAFTQGKCRFTYSMWTADTEADALAGRPNAIRPRLAREHTLYLAGDKFTIKTRLDAAEIRESLNSPAGLIVPNTVARNGAYALDHDGLANTVIVHSPENWRLKIMYHPFNLAWDAEFSPASSIAFAKARNFEGIEFEILEDQPYNQRRGIVLKERSIHSSFTSYEWIDPERGYLTFFEEDHDRITGAQKYRRFLLSVHEERGAYFPMHAISISPERTKEGTPDVSVREMRVDELDLSYQPTREDLTVYLPKDAQFSDGVNPNTAKTLFRRIDTEFAPVHVDEIEGIYNQLQDLAKQRAAEEAAAMAIRTPPAARPRGSILYWLAGVNLAALALILAVYWQRRRSSGCAAR